MLAVNLFHMRGGRVVDRREFFWEDLPEFAFPPDETTTAYVGTAAPGCPGEPGSPENSGISSTDGGQKASRALPGLDGRGRPSPHEHGHSDNVFSPGEFFSALLKQLYIGQPYVPRNIYVPVEFEDREMLEELLSEQIAGGGSRATRVHILVPRRGDKRALLDLAGNNAKQSYDQRFRVMKPNAKAIQEALQDALGLPERPHRIECFDISHIQGAETVASMVVWEDGKIKHAGYRN